MKDIQSQYNRPAETIFNEARGADTVLVIATKNGEPHLWADGNEKTAQALLSQYFPSAVLPRQSAEVE